MDHDLWQRVRAVVYEALRKGQHADNLAQLADAVTDDVLDAIHEHPRDPRTPDGHT